MDAVALARMLANTTFHILFPTISIALGWLLLFVHWRWLRTRADAWLLCYRPCDLPPMRRSRPRLVESVFRGRNGHEEEQVHR